MCIDLERDDESQPANSEDEDNDLLPPPKLRPIYETIGRSLDEILELEIELINSCTDLDPLIWVKIYAEKYREIMNNDSTIPKGVVKRMLYTK